MTHKVKLVNLLGSSTEEEDNSSGTNQTYYQNPEPQK